MADVSSDAVFGSLVEVVRSRQVLWLHAAPPCKTFSRARRHDRHGKVDALRTQARPEGIDTSPDVSMANLLAKRTAALARETYKVGGYFSIENPFDSFIWDLRDFKGLIDLDGVSKVYLDMCMHGSPHKKPTGIVTNAPWIVEIKCDGSHKHVPLEGKVVDCITGKRVWYTELAAECPEPF